MIFLLLLCLCLSPGEGRSSSWPDHGGGTNNARFYGEQTLLGPETVGRLEQHCRFSTLGSVSATPAFSRGVVYFPDWAGAVYAFDLASCRPLWRTLFASYTGIAGDFARNTPSLDEESGLLLLGSQSAGWLVAVSTRDGSLVWKTLLDDHPAAVITQSPRVFGRRVFCGVSSREEFLASTRPGYVCCSFVGSFQALDLRTGAVLWRFDTLPRGPSGYSGASVWGSSPPVDSRSRTVFLATGNLYRAPRSLPVPPDVHLDSVLALDMDDGSLRWSFRALASDAWTVACLRPGSNPQNCPSSPGPDADFGAAPLFLRRRGALLVGQKSGVAFRLRASDGTLQWASQAGPGGALGGSNWGAASDGRFLYLGIVNSNFLPFSMGPPTDRTVLGGGWVALYAGNGTVKWQTADPANFLSNTSYRAAAGAGPPSVSNGLVFVGSTDPEGHLYALDASDGKILWRAATGATIYGGPSVVSLSDSAGNSSLVCLLVGSGYRPAINPLYTPGNSVSAFCLRGKSLRPAR